MFKRILVPIDMNEPAFSERAVDIALREARLGNGQIHLMTVLPGVGSPLVADYFEPEALERARAAVRAQLASFTEAHMPTDISHGLSVHEGHPANCILHQAERMSADLIVMTAHHRGPLESALLGSNSSRVVERANCSVLILRGPADTENGGSR